MNRKYDSKSLIVCFALQTLFHQYYGQQIVQCWHKGLQIFLHERYRPRNSIGLQKPLHQRKELWTLFFVNATGCGTLLGSIPFCINTKRFRCFYIDATGYRTALGSRYFRIDTNRCRSICINGKKGEWFCINDPDCGIALSCNFCGINI